MINLKISKFLSFFFFVAVIFGFLSANKPLSLLPDMQVYSDYYEGILAGQDIKVEPTYYVLTKVLGYLGLGFSYLIFIYFFLSLLIKFYVVKVFSRKYTFALLYISSYFLLHELIQIRIGLAISFLFLGCFYFQRERNIASLICFLAASVFHFSTIPFIVFFYSSSLLIKSKLYLSVPVLLLFSIVLGLSGGGGMNAIGYLIPSFLEHKFEVYRNLQLVLDEHINLISIRLVVFYVVILSSWLKINKLQSTDRVILSAVSMMMALAFFTLSISTFSFRFFEIIGPFMIFFLLRMYDFYNKLFVNTLVFIFFVSSIYYSGQLIFS